MSADGSFALGFLIIFRNSLAEDRAAATFEKFMDESNQDIAVNERAVSADWLTPIG